MNQRISIGLSDFRQLRESRVLYVDKTAFITRVLEDSAQTILLPRPRRFGKTTNISTLRYFVEKSDEDRSALFADLAVWRSEAARAHFGRYPVIFLTFKDLKEATWESCAASLAEILSGLYTEHQYLLEQGHLRAQEAEVFTAILYRRATPVQCQGALKQLSQHLSAYHQQRVVILIDEYDTPLHAAFSAGYYDQAVAFFRTFLSGGLKDNSHLFKGVLTGILRIAKESIFSGLNNLAVYNLLNPKFATEFGFTEQDVEFLARGSGFTGPVDELRRWYNGYLFGGQVIYNPWSVLNFLASGTSTFVPYWINTSSDDLIRELVFRQGGAGGEMEALLQGQGVRKRILDNVVLRDIYNHPDALWSFLLFTGYLKAADVIWEDGILYGTLLLPNREVTLVFQDMFSDWLERGIGGRSQVEDLGRALLAGDLMTFERHLTRLLVDSGSYHDAAGQPVKMPPEAIYHAFILALLLHLQPRYLVRSNREAGYGRYDVMIVPREAGQPGVVLELKVKQKGETLAQAVARALEQLREKDYAAELRAVGAAPIRQVAVAFDGKKVKVGSAEEAGKRRRKGAGT